MVRFCKTCGGPLCDFCSGCITHGECDCHMDSIDNLKSRLEDAYLVIRVLLRMQGGEVTFTEMDAHKASCIRSEILFMREMDYPYNKFTVKFVSNEENSNE